MNGWKDECVMCCIYVIHKRPGILFNLWDLLYHSSATSTFSTSVVYIPIFNIIWIAFF